MLNRQSRFSDGKEAILDLLHLEIKNGGITPLELTQVIKREDEFLLGSRRVLEQDESPNALFLTQRTILLELGYPKHALDLIPFPTHERGLLVIPATLVPLKKQMEIVGIDPSRDDIYRGFDKNSQQTKPYWIYHLRVEEFLPVHTTESFRGVLKTKGRRGLTFAEGINLYAQDPILVLNMDGCLLFGATDENAPGLSVFKKSPQRIDVGPNNYHGGHGNGGHFVSCVL